MAAAHLSAAERYDREIQASFQELEVDEDEDEDEQFEGDLEAENTRLKRKLAKYKAKMAAYEKKIAAGGSLSARTHEEAKKAARGVGQDPSARGRHGQALTPRIESAAKQPRARSLAIADPPSILYPCTARDSYHANPYTPRLKPYAGKPHPPPDGTPRRTGMAHSDQGPHQHRPSGAEWVRRDASSDAPAAALPPPPAEL
jgi:hypothetical protein